MIIYGWKTYVRVLAVLQLVCGQCGNASEHVLRRLTRKVTLFWIPLFPIDRKHMLSCSACNKEQRISGSQAKELLATGGAPGPGMPGPGMAAPGMPGPGMPGPAYMSGMPGTPPPGMPAMVSGPAPMPGPGTPPPGMPAGPFGPPAGPQGYGPNTGPQPYPQQGPPPGYPPQPPYPQQGYGPR